jgi:hypothetical protein
MYVYYMCPDVLTKDIEASLQAWFTTIIKGVRTYK